MEKAVVTEALGFLGFHLCQRLLEEGIEVIALDRKSRSPEKEEKCHFFGRNSLFTFLEGNMDDIRPEDILNQVDVCFYLTPDTRSENWDARIAAALSLVRSFDAIGQDRPFLVCVSSTKVYGHCHGEIDEDHAPGPVTDTGAIRFAEEVLFRQSGLQKLAILRLSEVYGPGQSPEGSFHQLINGKIPDRKETDVIYIDDVIDALFSVASGTISGVFHITSGKSRQWVLGKQLITEKKISYPRDDGVETWYSIAKAEKRFGFQPKVSLEEGIKRQKAQMEDCCHPGN